MNGFNYVDTPASGPLAANVIDDTTCEDCSIIVGTTVHNFSVLILP